MNHGDIWALAEYQADKWTELTLELLGEAQRLASELGTRVVALVPRRESLAPSTALGAYGAELIYVLTDQEVQNNPGEALVDVLHSLIEKESPELVLIGSTPLGRDLAPRLAARLKTGFVADCLDVRLEEQAFSMTRASYGGSVYSTWTCSPTRPVILTFREGVVAKFGPEPARLVDIEEKVETRAGLPRTRIVDVISADPKTMDISEADVVVTCGRGLGSKDNLSLLERLAQLLGASVGGSRPAIDYGWLESERQVGLTGKTLSAKLLMAFGISGASQHIQGIKDCEFVIAVNKDRSAPIFQFSDIAVVADMHRLLPGLISRLGDAQQRITAGDSAQYRDVFP